MKINLFDGVFEFGFDWKAIVGVGIIILGYALLNMLGDELFCWTNTGNMWLFIWGFCGFYFYG